MNTRFRYKFKRKTIFRVSFLKNPENARMIPEFINSVFDRVIRINQVMCRALPMSKSSTASLKKLLKISAHVSGLLIISFPLESIILLFQGVLSEKKGFTCFLV